MMIVAVGGARDNAGRKDAYGGKDMSPVPMVFTPNGEAVLIACCESTGLSRNDVMTHLCLRYAKELRFNVDGIVFPGKDYKAVRSIRVTSKARKLLDDARERTSKSYSDLGEALLVTFGEKCKDWPAPYERDRRRKKQHGR